jgi:RNA-directed DNA polymerase
MEETVAQQDPQALRGKPGKKPHVHALLAKVCSRTNLERAWEQVKKNRGSAGIDDVTSAQFAARQAASLDLLHRKLRDGT